MTPINHWPFVETPGAFTVRLQAASAGPGGLLAGVRTVLIEQPPTISDQYLAQAQDAMYAAEQRRRCKADIEVGPAFAAGNGMNQVGMSLRDYFAAAAINQAVSLCSSRDGNHDPAATAVCCYDIADALLAERGAAVRKSDRLMAQDAFVYAACPGEICAGCGATLDTMNTACTADMLDPCPGFLAIENAKQRFNKEFKP